MSIPIHLRNHLKATKRMCTLDSQLNKVTAKPQI